MVKRKPGKIIESVEKLRNEISQAMKTTRKDKTQKQLADACGMSRTAVQRIETGSANMTIKSICILGDVLGFELQVAPKEKK